MKSPNLSPSAHPLLRLLLAVAMLLGGRAEVRAAAGKITSTLGSAIPDSSSPGGGYFLTRVKVTIAPADAVTAGATWTLDGGTSPMPSGSAELFIANASGTHVLKFSTVPGFQAPIRPSVTLTKGFETDVIFTYARTVPPALPDSADAAGTRGVAFTYTPTVTNSPATSFAVTVGGGETLTTLGLSLNATNGRLTGTPLKSGTFTLMFTASNSAGKSQPMTLTLTVIEPGQLTVTADKTRGSVSVSPNRPGNFFLETESVTLTAKPKTPEFFFSNWQFTGVTPSSTTSATTSFKFSPAQLVVTATANFVANPFLSRAGNYTGRIAPASGVSLANSGLLTITLTNLGQYSGKLRFSSGSYSFRGQFQLDGSTAPFTISRAAKSPPLANLDFDLLQLDLKGGDVITGRVTAGQAILFSLDRAVFDAKNHPCPQAGPIDPKTHKAVAAKYTIALLRDPAKAGDKFPQGHGYGVVTVNPDGSVRYTGALGDGTALTQSSVISKTGRWPFHAVIYSNGGVLTGDLTFRDIANVSDLDGTLDWTKPALVGASVTYPAGYTTQTSVIGSHYDKSIAVPNGTVKFGEGNLAVMTGSIPVTSTAGGLVAIPPVAGFSFPITQATGLFTGTLPTSVSTKPVKFHGAILQKTQHGYGWFIGVPLPSKQGLPTGYVEFTTP